jgi:hypothetical protein
MSRVNSLSTNPNAIPASSKLNIGQIAINMADGKLYIKLLNNQVICVGADVSTFATKQELQQVQTVDLSGYALTATVTQSLNAIGQQLQFLATALSGKAEQQHGHGITEVFQLGETLATMQEAIDSKQPSGNYATSTHGHTVAQVDGLQATINALIAQIQSKQPVGDYQPAGSYAPLAGVTGNWTCNALIGNSYVRAGAGFNFRIGNMIVVKEPQSQGWQITSGAISTASFNTASVTPSELAKRVGAIQNALIYHGLLATTGTTIV